MEELNAYCTEKNIAFEDIFKCPFYPIGWYYIICSKDEEDDPEIDRGVNKTVFEIYEVNGRARVERFDKWHVCHVKDVNSINKLLAKQKIVGKKLCFC